MKELLKKILLGTNLREEYICLNNDPEPGMMVFLGTRKGNQLTDISQKQILLGYKPLLVGIITSSGSNEFGDEICLSFSTEKEPEKTKWKDFLIADKAVATILMRQVKMQNYGDVKIQLYEGVLGEHRFLSAFHQFTNGLYQRLKNKKESNIHLGANLYEQVRIAYSIPRTIAYITIAEGELINIFPTDLHGRASSEIYFSSLRINGKACEQVMRNKKILLSELKPDCCREAYSLGARHMKDPEAGSSFRWMKSKSERFQFPIPLGTVSYFELEVKDHFDAGIHRIFVYDIVNSKKLEDSPVLKHVHAYYIQWLLNQGVRVPVITRV